MAKFPTKLGACIDLAYTSRAERIEYQREVDGTLAKMRANEQALEDHIINTFSKADIEGAKGSLASASITRAVYPKVVDWDKAWAFIVKYKAYDLMERRMAKVAFRERHGAGIAIPGVEPFEKMDLSLTKINGKG